MEKILFAKMRPLESLQRVLTWLCACPAEQSASTQKRRAYFAFSLFLFVSALSCGLSGGVFMIKYIKTDLEGCFYCLFEVAGAITMSYLIAFAVLSRHKINAIFEHLATIYDACRLCPVFTKKNEIIYQSLFQNR